MKILSILTAFVLLFMLTSCGPQQKDTGPPEVAVTVTPVTMGDIISSEEIVGQCVAYDSVDLMARVKGFLEKWNFTEGQLVKKGQLLFLIEQDQYKAEVESAQAGLKKAEAALQKANIDYNRYKYLVEQNATAKKTYDQAVCEKLTAEANVLAAKASLSEANLSLSYTEVKAPFDGRIGLATYSVGNLVDTTSQKLASVVKLDPMRVQFNVSETIVLQSALKRLRDHKFSPKDLIIKLKLENNEIYSQTGKIRFWSNKINTSTGTLLVEAVFSNPNLVLIPGQYVKVILESPKKLRTLLIPRSTIQDSQLGKYVLVVDKDNKVSKRQIKTGEKSGALIAVKNGLKEGELVISQGLQKVSPNVKVKPVIDQTYTDGGKAKTYTPPKSKTEQVPEPKIEKLPTKPAAPEVGK